MDEKIKYKLNKIKEFVKQVRKDVIYLSYRAKTAHLASSLSCVEIISTIYQEYFKSGKGYINKHNRNRFILSKGHAASTLYSVLYRKKIISKTDINSFCKPGSKLEEHPSHKIKGVECATGSLGHGLSIGAGLALGYKIKKFKSKIFVLLSDGECNEGSVWEAAMFASAKKLNNLIVFIDYNKWQATGKSDQILNISPLDLKFKSFGWNVIRINGNKIKEILLALKKNYKNSKPTLILADTIKGFGVSFMQDDNNWHYKSPNNNELKKALAEIEKNF